MGITAAEMVSHGDQEVAADAKLNEQARLRWPEEQESRGRRDAVQGQAFCPV